MSVSPKGGLDGILKLGGLNSLTDLNGRQIVRLKRSEIRIEPQQREQMEDDENSIADMGKSIIKTKGVIHPIVVREKDGFPEPFTLVAGQRRIMGTEWAFLETGDSDYEYIDGMIFELTDEEAAQIQFAENVQRKNLTQLETAKRLKARLQELGGDIEALMEDTQKSRAWISKWLSLASLSPIAKSVVEQNLSADLEVVTGVQTVEKINPEIAAELVTTLKENAGVAGFVARDAVQGAKDKAKGKPPREKGEKKPNSKAPKDHANVAKPIDRSHQEPGPVRTVNTEEQTSMLDDLANTDDGIRPAGPASTFDASGSPALPPVQALDKAYVEISECGAEPKALLTTMSEEERDNVDNWLHAFFAAGQDCKEPFANAVFNGLRTKQFANEGHGAFAMVAFLFGAENITDFNLVDILKAVKA